MKSIKNSGQTSLSSTPLAIMAVVILVLIIIIFLITFFPVSSVEENIAFECTNITSLKDIRNAAVLSEGVDKTALVSGENSSADYIQIYYYGSFIEVAQNIFKNENNPEQKLVASLKEKEVDGIVLSNPSEKMVSEIVKANMKCYKANGTIIEFIGSKLEVIDDPNAYCKHLDDINSILETKLAVSSDSTTTNSFVSIMNAKSPYFIIYENGVKIESIENTFIDSSNREKEITDLLKSKGVETILVGVGDPAFEIELEKAGINCYKTSQLVIVVPE